MLIQIVYYAVYSNITYADTNIYYAVYSNITYADTNCLLCCI